MLKKTHRIAYLAGLVYFIQGALGIAGVTLPLYLRSLNWTITEITTISSIAAGPWVLKIVYGLLSDSFPIFGYRRKSYLVLSSIISALGWLGLFFLPSDKAWILMCLMTANMGFAATDVVTDGLIVEHSAEQASAFYQSIAWGFRSLGAFLSGFASGWLAEHWPANDVFLLTASLPLVVAFFCLFLTEKKIDALPFKTVFEPVKRCSILFMNANLRCFTFILIFSAIGSSFGIPFFFHMKESLGFKESFLGILTSTGWAGAMLCSLIYANWLRKISAQKLLFWAIAINTLNIFSTLFITDQRSAFILVFIGGMMGCMTLVPVMTAAAKLTHHSGVEGTLFAILMSIYNFGQIGFGFLGGKVFSIIGLQTLIIVTGCLSLFGLFFVRKLKI